MELSTATDSVEITCFEDRRRGPETKEVDAHLRVSQAGSEYSYAVSRSSVCCDGVQRQQYSQFCVPPTASEIQISLSPPNPTKKILPEMAPP